MTILIIAMLLTQTPADAPVAEDGVVTITAPVAPVTDMKVEAGNIVPFNGYCVEEKEFIRREKINVRNDVELTEAKKSLLIPTAAFVAIVLGTLATGLAAGFAVDKLIKR